MQSSSEQIQRYMTSTLLGIVDATFGSNKPVKSSCNVIKLLQDSPDLLTVVLSWLWVRELCYVEAINRYFRHHITSDKSLFPNILKRAMSATGRHLAFSAAENMTSARAKLLLRRMTSAPTHVDYRSVFRSKKFT